MNVISKEEGKRQREVQMSQLNPLRNSEYIFYLSYFESQFCAKRCIGTCNANFV